MMKNFGKWVVLLLLIATVAIVLLVKRGKKEVAEKPMGEVQKPETINLKMEKEEKEEPLKEPTKKEEAKMEKDVLALVGNGKITKEYLEEKYQSLPDEYKDMYKNDKEGFLEQLIIRELLFQEAARRGLTKNLEDVSEEERKKDMAIELLIRELTEKIEIPEKELEDFYNAHQSEMGKSYSEVKEEIRSYLKEQKQGEVITQYIDNLKEKVKVIRNEEWIKEQRRLKPPNPLDKALKSGKPTVLDLGAGYCVPCKMMKPIFEELEREYEGKANIILLEISEYRDLANRYRVRVIPTQIFFDKNGNQYWRHEGFLAKEEIVKKLKELGVE
ncbi:MAG: thioredoxin domain-containing protein [candidate division WOR-3 bacterium]